MSILLTQTPPETSNVSVNDKEIDISNIIYVTYVDTKYNDKQELGQIETNIMNTLVNNFVRLTGAVNKSSFNVYNIRFGPSTTSIEVGIELGEDETITIDTVKQAIVDMLTQGVKDDFKGIKELEKIEQEFSKYLSIISQEEGKKDYDNQLTNLKEQLGDLIYMDRLDFIERIGSVLAEASGFVGPPLHPFNFNF